MASQKQASGDFIYTRTTRAPIYILCGVFCVLLLIIAIMSNAPWWIWVLWGPASAVLFYLLWANKHYGIRLTATHLIVGSDSAGQSYALSKIDHVAVRNWSDSTDYELHLTDGARISVFSENMPGISTTKAEFGKRGIRVEVS